MSTLTFEKLREKNVEREAEWLGDNGEPSSLEFRTIELGGETGELQNAIKKLLRFRLGMAGGIDEEASIEHIREEIGDVGICLDLVCQALDIDLGDAIAEKFNKTSRKHGFKTMIEVG